MTTEDLMKLADAYARLNAQTTASGAGDARQALLDALEAQGREVAELGAEYEEVLKLHNSLINDAVTIREDRDTLRAELAAIRAKQKDVVPQAWTNLLAYVLQDDTHNRLTPRVVDIAYTAFYLAKEPNKEDGGASDWFNDTKPKVAEMIEKLRKDLCAELDPAPAAPVVKDDKADAQAVAWLHFDAGAERCGKFPWMLMVNQDHKLIAAKTKRIELHSPAAIQKGQQS